MEAERENRTPARAGSAVSLPLPPARQWSGGLAAALVSSSHAAARALVLVAGGAAFTALCAQARIPLPFTPVPLTLQVLAVLLCGGLMGSRLGAASLAAYGCLGLTGLPVFASSLRGFAALAGPTGGYIIGFVPAAWLVGRLSRNGARGFPGVLGACMAGVMVIHLFGWAWLSVWLAASVRGWQVSVMGAALMQGFVPFVAPDAAKGLVAALLLRAVPGVIRKTQSTPSKP
jgi:biotin transport system substrate-specific component